MCCPACGHEKEMVIEAVMWVGVTDDGTDPFADSTRNMGGITWDDESGCRCSDCGHQGTVKDFTFNKEDKDKAAVVTELMKQIADANLYWAVENTIREIKEAEAEAINEEPLITQLKHILSHRCGGSTVDLQLFIKQLIEVKK